MSSKLIAFYSGTLALVIALFQGITNYGENNLKAPPTVQGHYVSTTAPPNCDPSTRLVLDLEQSGVYLNAAIALQDLTQSPPTAQPQVAQPQIVQPQIAQPQIVQPKTDHLKPALTGHWSNHQITLAGNSPALMECLTKPAIAQPIRLSGQVHTATDITFSGQIISGGQPWQFTAQRQAIPEVEKLH